MMYRAPESDAADVSTEDDEKKKKMLEAMKGAGSAFSSSLEKGAAAVKATMNQGEAQNKAIAEAIKQRRAARMAAMGGQ